MCGIVGFTRPRRGGRGVLEAMTASLSHRGPDEEGYFVDAAIAFGHRRLAVVDPEGGAQPRTDEKSGDALVFGGEIYGYREHAERLRGEGVPIKDKSDTEVLFWLLRRHGVQAALERLDGMFAFAYRDGATGTLWLARDRFGEKPLFYGIASGALVFASELRAIVLHPAFAACAPDLQAVDRYLTFEYVPGDRTGLSGIAKLPPGHLLAFRDGVAEVRSYWRPAIGARPGDVSEQEAVRHLEHLLDASVRQRLIADVPVGVFLSGGVDSSLVAAFAARHSPGVSAFTVRMPDSSYDETPFASGIAKRYGMRHRVVDLSGAELAEACASVASHLDELIADSSLIPTYLICRAARRDVVVALGGDGADELFGGYPNFRARIFSRLMEALPESWGRQLHAGLSRLPASDRYMGIDFVVRQLCQGVGKRVDHQSYHWMAPFGQEEKKSLWRSGLAPTADVFAPITGDRGILDRDAPTNPVDRLLHQFTLTYLPEDILAKVDRASMQNSLEVRSPYLDRAFAEYAMALPSRLKVSGLATKRALKRLAERHLPRDTARRAKHGFAIPLARLLRGALREQVADVLLDAGNPAAHWFERTGIERYLRQHLDGSRDHRKKIWTLYVLFTVMSRHLRPSAASGRRTRSADTVPAAG
jgi:asparagine synthase (glutamine-hydrolysing)